MLHFHVQNTAALWLPIVSGQAILQNTAALWLPIVSGQAILQKLTRKDIFVKEADMKILANSLKLINI
jgi:hypothetical protein